MLRTLFITLLTFGLLPAATKPNIVFVITDDQGYGDLGYTGNPIIKTPHIDALAMESTGLSDFHVGPTCSPTRCSLITGRWTNRTGVWHTIMGRSMLRENEVTIGQMLNDAGYETGMFGKWHLGDNYPYRPEDRGFTEVYRHGGGGIGQTPDVWDNAYFDGSYFHNGKIVPAKGFCTDVFFEQANGFIKKCVEEKKPFFAYISTNAPHKPLHTPKKYMDLYKDQSENLAAFFGMITNIDENVGKTRALIEQLGIEKNTIFIFTTDNGTAGGSKVFNAGMRGNKGSPLDGGHRVPFFIRWPAGGLDKEYDVKTLTHMVDIVPTLLELTGSKKPEGVKFDGLSLVKLLKPGSKDVAWPERYVISDSQRVMDPIKWRGSCVMSEQYRLIKGKELYDIDADPAQRNNIADKHPEIVADMRAFYEKWWAELQPTFSQTTEIYLGHPEALVATLTAHDWIQKVYPPWNQGTIRSNKWTKSEKDLEKHVGYWAVKVVKDGNYRFSVRRWPAESGAAINASLPAGENVPGTSQAFRTNPGEPIGATAATLRIDGRDLQTKPVAEGTTEVTFETKLKAGSYKLAPYFTIPEGELGAYYTTVSKVPEPVLIDSIGELIDYAAKNNVHVRLKPGTYTLDKADSHHFIRFTGNGGHFDLTGVTLRVDTKLFKQSSLPKGRDSFYCVINLLGNNIMFEGGSIETFRDLPGVIGRNKVFNVSGSNNTVRNLEVTTAGSNPWGYGSLFGISDGDIRKMNGIRIAWPAVGTKLISCRVHMRAMGHAIFVQGAEKTLIEDCHVDGLLRTTDEILAETSGYAHDRNFKTPGKNYSEGVKIGPNGEILPGEMISCSEDGIRLYGMHYGNITGPTTIRNCTVTKMRRGICTGLNQVTDTVINCVVTDCVAAGFNIDAGDQLENCHADAKYSEALSCPYGGSAKAKVDLKILDSRDGLSNKLLATINGHGHEINFHTEDPQYVPDHFEIATGTVRGYAFYQKRAQPAKDIKLENHTWARVVHDKSN